MDGWMDGWIDGQIDRQIDGDGDGVSVVLMNTDRFTVCAKTQDNMKIWLNIQRKDLILSIMKTE